MAGKKQGSSSFQGYQAVVEVEVSKKVISDMEITCTNGVIHSCDEAGGPKPGEQIFIAGGDIISRFVEIAGGKPGLIRAIMFVKPNQNPEFQVSTPWFSNNREVKAADTQPVTKVPAKPAAKETTTTTTKPMAENNVAEPINSLVKHLFDQVGLTPDEIDKIDLTVMASGKFRSSEIKAAEAEIAQCVAKETRNRRVIAINATAEALSSATDVLYAGLSAIPGFTDRYPDGTEFGLKIIDVLNIEKPVEIIEPKIKPVTAEAVAEEQAEAAEKTVVKATTAPEAEVKPVEKPPVAAAEPSGLGTLRDRAKIVQSDEKKPEEEKPANKRTRTPKSAKAIQIGAAGDEQQPDNNGQAALVGAATPFDSSAGK